ncbi:MAG: hypothetical protein ABIU77_04410 [Ferruginibacter sp.]
MKKVLTGILIVGIILSNYGCPKPCVEANYSFAVTANFTPDMDSVKIGDTIFLTSSFPTTLQETQISKLIDYSDASDIGNTISVSQLLPTDSLAKDAVFDFNYVSIIGKIYNDRNIPRPDGVNQLTYSQVGNNYELKIGIIPKKSGVYGLGLGNALSNGRKKGSSCEKASFNTTVVNTNQHFYLFNLWRPDVVIDQNGRRGVYFFKVL